MKHICDCGNEHEIEGDVDIYDPAICPSSLDEFHRPLTEGETAHKWDDTTDPITCAECGTEKD